MRFLVLGLLLVCSAVTQARTTIQTEDGSGIHIEVDPLYEATPPAGGFPVRVKIVNGSNGNGVWQASFQSPHWGEGVRSEFELRVEEKSARTFEILVPIIHGFGSSIPPQPIRGSLMGPRVRDGNFTMGQDSAGGRSSTQGYFLVGEKATMDVWTAITEDHNKRSVGIFGTRLDVTRLPTDPRAWWGVDSVWLNALEMQTLRPEQTEALYGWVARGGRLFIVGDSTDYPSTRFPKSVLPDEMNVNFSYGLGNIRYRPGLDTAALTKEMLATFQKPVELLGKANDNSNSTSKQLIDAVAPRKIPGIPLVLFTVVFAVLVGPINLFVFARKGQRHRLFFTTPLLSLGGCALALILIFALDGPGGTGKRLLLVQALPDRNEHLLFQQQLARTGLLFRSGFSVTEPVAALMKGDPDQSGFSARNTKLNIQGNAYSGHWFKNRSLTSMELETLRSSRARIDLVSANPPVIVSSFEPTFSRLFYKNEAKDLWIGEFIEKGKRHELRRATDQETAAFLQVLPPAGHRVKHVVEAAFIRPHSFIAFTDDAGADAIATHPAIRWEPTPGWYFGEVTP